jgi:hypothetical protein
LKKFSPTHNLIERNYKFALFYTAILLLFSRHNLKNSLHQCKTLEVHYYLRPLKARAVAMRVFWLHLDSICATMIQIQEICYRVAMPAKVILLHLRI